MPEGKLWILERIASKRFPYRIRIVKGDKPLLALKVQSKAWQWNSGLLSKR